MWGENWGTMVWGGAAAQVPIGPWTLLILGFLLGVCALKARESITARVFPVLVIIFVPLIVIVANAVTFTFENGTVADAVQVNQNFSELEAEIDALKADVGSFTVSGSGTENSLPVPNDVVDEFCGDIEGCEVTLTLIKTLDPALVVAGRLKTSNLIGGDRGISAQLHFSQGFQQVEGRDRNNVSEIFFSPSITKVICNLQDYAVVNGVAQPDDDIGLHFNPNVSNPLSSCALTIRD